MEAEIIDLKLKEELINYLFQFITENKRDKIEKVSLNRTSFITMVLEDIREPKDASAVIRSCECFGIQMLNIIENKTKYRLNPDVVMGSSKWTDIYQFKKAETNNTEVCINKLKEEGYRIIAMTPSENSFSLDDFEINQKSAFLFGSEEDGLSEYALKNSDQHLKIPMYGFSDSYNLSVSVAITIHNLILKLNKSSFDWKLSADEITDLRLKWIKKVIKKAENLEKLFLEQKFHNNLATNYTNEK